MKSIIFVLLMTLALFISGCGGGTISDSYSYETPVDPDSSGNSSNSNGSDSSGSYNNSGNSSNSNNSGSSSGSASNSGNNDSTNNNTNTNNTIDAHDVNVLALQRAITNNKVKGWSSSDNPKELYLAILNYIRSLPIKCNDTQAFVGPSDPLKWDDQLELAAQEHSADMLQNEYFSHTGSDGSSPVDRIENNGFTGSTYGENIAYRHSKGIPYTGYEWIIAFAQWLDSTEGHCSNLMSKNFTHVGMYESKKVAGSENTLYWTQDFGRK